MNWLIALGVILVGLLLVLKTGWIVDFIGRIEWAEQHAGGTFMFVKMIGVIVIIFALLGATGILGNMLHSFLDPLFGIKPSIPGVVNE